MRKKKKKAAKPILTWFDETTEISQEVFEDLALKMAYGRAKAGGDLFSRWVAFELRTGTRP